MPNGAAAEGGAGTHVMAGGPREELRFTSGNGTVKSLLAGRSELVSSCLEVGSSFLTTLLFTVYFDIRLKLRQRIR